MKRSLKLLLAAAFAVVVMLAVIDMWLYAIEAAARSQELGMAWGIAAIAATLFAYSLLKGIFKALKGEQQLR